MWANYYCTACTMEFTIWFQAQLDTRSSFSISHHTRHGLSHSRQKWHWIIWWSQNDQLLSFIFSFWIQQLKKMCVSLLNSNEKKLSNLFGSAPFVTSFVERRADARALHRLRLARKLRPSKQLLDRAQVRHRPMSFRLESVPSLHMVWDRPRHLTAGKNADMLHVSLGSCLCKVPTLV